MKAKVIGHLTLDKVQVINGKRKTEYESLGGPPSYSGILLSRLGADVDIDTRFGHDILDPWLLWLSRNGVKINDNSLSDKPTTRFRIEVDKKSRRRALYILSMCDAVKIDPADVDISLVQPVDREIEEDLVKELKSRCSFLYLDPQGFLRAKALGKVMLVENDKLAQQLKYVDAMKVDEDEGYMLTKEREPFKIASRLLKFGVKEVIVTYDSRSNLYMNGKESYLLELPNIRSFDGIGAGDMLGAAYSYARQSMEPSSSFLFAVSAAVSCIERKGLEKIPAREKIDAMQERLKHYLKKLT